jgi:hypothetical protein
MATKTITYNSYNLQTSSIVMTNLEFQTIGKDLSITRISTTDINKFVESYVSNKNIVYTGYIKGTNDSDAEAKLDELKQSIVINGVADLDIGYAGGVRRYRAVVQNIEVTGETPALDVKDITITFATVEPLGFDTTSQVINYLGETGSPTKTITFSGTYYALPTYTITVDTENNLTGISIKSVETNQEIIIQQNYNAGDVVEVNTRDKIVSYNGNSVDYFGIFPLVNQGLNNITFSATSTSHTIDIEIEYIPRYL